MNPMFVQKEQKKKDLEFNSQFNITFINDYRFSDSSKYMFIKQFCEENKISFILRNYNSVEFQDDCDYISKLPAFHLYFQKKGYINTFHLSDDVIRQVEHDINNIKIEEEKKKLRKDWYRSFVSWIWK